LLISTALGSYTFYEKRQSSLQAVASMANASEAQFASGNRLDALMTAIAAQAHLDRLLKKPPRLTTQI
jgi:hypothetical protein